MDALGATADLMTAERKNNVARIVRDVGGRLKRFIRSQVSTDADAEDVLQDVWQRLVVTLDNGPIEQVSAWLYTVARNRIIDRYRRPRMQSLEGMADESADETVLEIADFLLRDNKTPATEHLRSVFWEELHAGLAEMPEEQRQVFVWHELEGLSFQEIAALTGENQNTLLSRKRYAVLFLRRRLARLRDEFPP